MPSPQCPALPTPCSPTRDGHCSPTPVQPGSSGAGSPPQAGRLFLAVRAERWGSLLGRTPFSQTPCLHTGGPAKAGRSSFAHRSEQTCRKCALQNLHQTAPWGSISEQEPDRRDQKEGKHLPSKRPEWSRAWGGEGEQCGASRERAWCHWVEVQTGGSGLLGKTVSTGPQRLATPFCPGRPSCVTSPIPARPSQRGPRLRKGDCGV